MLEVRTEPVDEPRSLRVDRDVGTGRCGEVRLVEDEEVERPRELVGLLAGDRAVEHVFTLGAFQPVDRRDEPRVRLDRVDVAPTGSGDLPLIGRVENAKLDTESFTHLDLPFLDQASWTDDECVADAVAEDELLKDEPGFDGLAEPDIVSDQQQRPGHIERSDEGFELVGLQVDARPVRRLEHVLVGVRDRSPSDGPKECVEASGVVPLAGRRCRDLELVEHGPLGLDLPDELSRHALVVLADRPHGHDVIRAERAVLEWVDMGDNPCRTADVHGVSQLRKPICSHHSPQPLLTLASRSFRATTEGTVPLRRDASPRHGRISESAEPGVHLSAYELDGLVLHIDLLGPPSRLEPCLSVGVGSVSLVRPPRPVSTRRCWQRPAQDLLDVAKLQ